MEDHPVTIIVRHKRENLKKCSLRGLESDPRFVFYLYPQTPPLPQEGIYLTIDAPLLSKNDRYLQLILLDGTWRHAKVMERIIPQTLITRSLSPEWKTAYPRRQEDCEDPSRGLASIEALFAAYLTLGFDTKGLLDRYYWKDAFLSLNASIIDKITKQEL